MKEASSKTSVITFRVPEELLDFIRQEALEKKVSLNTVVNQILTKHHEWDAFAQKYGFVSFPPEYYKDLLETVDEKDLTRKGLESGSQSRDYVLQRWKKADIETMLEAFRVSSKYSGLGNLEMKKEGSRFQLYIHHGFGRKHSLYVKGLLESAILAAGSTPTSEMTANSVIVEFQTPRSRFVADIRRQKTAKASMSE